MNNEKYNPKYFFPNSRITVNCCDDEKETARPSAFRAVNNTVQQNVAEQVTLFPVLYPDVMFDLNNEYNPVTSTFTPKQDGIYSIIASVNFAPIVNGVFTPTNYRVLVQIHVNGNPIVGDNDFFGEIPIGDATSVSAILQLSAGDKVNVSTISSTNGILFANSLANHFEAARLPYQLIKCPPANSITPLSNASGNIEL